MASEISVNNDKNDQQKEILSVFWDTIEKMTGAIIPIYIREILNIHGFNSPMSVALLDIDDLNEIEKAVRADNMKRSISTSTPTENTEVQRPHELFSTEFCFPRGYRKALIKISELIREKGSENILCHAESNKTDVKITSKNRVISSQRPMSTIHLTNTQLTPSKHQ